MSDYYNEHDPFAAAWLRELIAAGEIPAGDVDERSIEDVVPSDLVGYRHCHFFAGIGGWAYALRLADWPDDQPIWTGSCPCQPFSAAGQGAGFADERHLWPAFFWLISQCQPRYVCGEQVASGDALRWWDLVATDLEGAGYACTAVDLPAASVGAPHKRSRLFWLADAEHQQQHGRGGTRRRWAESPDNSVVSMADAVSAGRAEGWPIAGLGSVAISGASSVVVADAEHTGHDRPRGAASEPDCDQQRQRLLDGDCRACRVADTDGGHTSAAREQRSGQHGLRTASGHAYGAACLTECADHAISMADADQHGAQRAGRAQFVADVRCADGGVADTVPAGRAEGRAITRRGSVAISGASGLLADADSERERSDTRGACRARDAHEGSQSESGRLALAVVHSCADGGVANPSDYGCCGRSRPERDSAGTGQSHACGHQPDGCGDAGDGMGDTRGAGSAEQRWRRDESSRLATASGADAWADLEWLPCTDGKARPTESRILSIPDELSDQLGYSRNARGTWTLSPLIQKTTNRAGRLRGYGNAIVPQAAAEVLRAWQAVMR